MKSNDSLLPTVARTKPVNPRRLKYLLIGPPKFGKTTFFSGCPGVCLLAFEAGYGEVDCPKIVITSWNRSLKERKLGWDQDEDGIMYASGMEVIEEMERYCPYEMVVIDTLDMATKMASDYYCEKANIDHPSMGGDWGRGWEIMQTNPVRRLYNRLLKLGVGVACITHSTEKEKDGRVKRETSLPGKIQHYAHTQADCIMHGYTRRLTKGQRDSDRIISFDGSDKLMAGTRIRKVYIPNQYVMTPPTRTDDSPPWRQWENFFTNNPVAGQEAEKQFASLIRGEQEQRTETNNSTYVKKDTKTGKVSLKNRS
jgi:AAA domain